MECLKLKFRSILLQFLTICMVVGLITPVRSVSALEEETETITQEEVEPIIIGEDVSSRDESSKTFILSNQTYQTILYSIPVHYQEDGVWKEIDNTLIDDGLSVEEDVLSTENEPSSINEVLGIDNEESSLSVEQEDQTSSEGTVTEEVIETNTEEIIETNNEVIVATDINEETTSTNISVIEDESETESQASTTDDEVVGYTNKEGNFKIKFAKKAHKKNMVSFQDGEYKVTWGFSDLTNKSAGVVTTKEETDDEIQKVINKIGQTISYDNILDGVDIIYHIDSLQIKEDIVISQPTDVNEFTFEYKVNNLTLELTDEGSIEAKNEDGEVIFVMPKPYMYDGEGNYCYDVHYEMSQKNKKYTITVVADKDWMYDESRAYPIIIDPVIQTQQTSTDIYSTFISSADSGQNFGNELDLYVGRDTDDHEDCRTLLKFNLPTMKRGDMIIEAKFCAALQSYSFYDDTTPDLQINAHMINTSWNETIVTWNGIKGSGDIDDYYDPTILDYDFIHRTDAEEGDPWKVFDVTTAVKKWYNGEPNYGILLKSYNESGTDTEVGVCGQFWSEENEGDEIAFPYLAIMYRSNKGIESYYDYTSFSTYDAGNVYIDNYSGNLVIIREDTTTYGSRMPISIQHVYNAYLADSHYTQIDPVNLGNGWKLNIHQTIKPSTEYGLSGESAATYPYVYMDGDGTEHYFIKKDDQYLDETGMGLELTITTDGYTLTDKKDNIMTFDSNGKLTSIKDVNDNEIIILFSFPAYNFE